MRARVWMTGLAALSIVLGGCGDEAESYTPTELGAVLLTAEDLGSGWSEQMREVITTPTTEIPSLDPNLWCPDAADAATELQALNQGEGAAVALMEETPRQTSHQVMERLWNRADAEDYYTKIEGSLATCSGAEWTDPDGNPITLESLETSTVGDESTTYLWTITTTSPAGEMTWRVRGTVARFGDTLMWLFETDVRSSDDEPALTDTEWQTIVDTAAVKIGELGTS